jgi:saxitoxin biosynthesis operon SxtJ-like protein
MKDGQTHETLAHDHDVKMGSDRGFGLVFAVVFGLIGVWPALTLGWAPRFDPAALRMWSLAVCGVFLAAALLRPDLLHPLNRLWFAFGLLLGKIVAPVVMGLLFVLAVVPTALVMRLRGHDLLRLKIDRNSKSYWIMRDPPGPAGDSMRNQF